MVMRTVVCVVLLVALSPACSRSDEPKVLRRLESDRYDIEVGQLGDTAVTRSVVLKSTGLEPVTIERIGTYAGSITTRLRSGAGEFQVAAESGGKTHFVLPAGQTVLLEITVDPKGLGESHSRRVTVHSDDSVEPTLSLTLSMKPAPAMTASLAQPPSDGGPPPHIVVSEQKIDFGEIFVGEVPRRVIKVSNTGEGSLTVRRVHSTCGCTAARKVKGGMDANLKDLETGKQELVLKPGEETEIEISLDSSKMNGVLEKEVKIESNDVERNPVSVIVHAKAVKPVELTPERLSFGRVVHYTEVAQSVVASSSRLKDFAITGIQTSQPYVKATWSKIDDPSAADHPKYKIDVTVTADAPVGVIQDPIIVKTSSERCPEFQLPMVANVVPPITFDTMHKDGAERIDFGVLKEKTPVSREVRVTNSHPETPYLIKSAEVESVQKDHFTCEVETKNEGREYIVRISTKPSLDTRYFKGWLVLKSDHPDLLEKRIPFQGWIVSETPR